MALNITKTTITKAAYETTDNASYSINFIVIDGQLQSVRADVSEKAITNAKAPEGTVDVMPGHFIGTLAMENGIMRSTNFPYTEKYALYVSDFVSLVELIKATI